MSYYQSNQAYNHAHNQDGVMNGAIIGGAIGAGITGGVHGFGNGIVKSRRDSVAKKLKDSEKAMIAASTKNGVNVGQALEALKDHQGNEARAEKSTNRLDRIERNHNKAFGKGWKGKTLAYGGSAILGMGVGAGIDAMVD